MRERVYEREVGETLWIKKNHKDKTRLKLRQETLAITALASTNNEIKGPLPLLHNLIHHIHHRNHRAITISLSLYLLPQMVSGKDQSNFCYLAIHICASGLAWRGTVADVWGSPGDVWGISCDVWATFGNAWGILFIIMFLYGWGHVQCETNVKTRMDVHTEKLNDSAQH